MRMMRFPIKQFFDVKIDMNTDIKYTLIIPHHDDFERLEYLLSTVPVQRQDLEVIVVDDSSVNKSSLKMTKENWPMVNWFSTENNSGAGVARNIGLNNSNGDFLLFADSDDYFCDNAFQVLDDHLTDEDQIVYFYANAKHNITGKRSVRADGLNALCENYLNHPSDITLERLKLGHTVPWAKAYSGKYIKFNGFKFDETRHSNDVMFNVSSAVHAEKIRVVPIVIYTVLRTNTSLTSDLTSEAFIERVEVKARLASYLNHSGFKEMPSATGFMLHSLLYSPVTAYHVWKVCIRSDMRIDLSKFFNLFRWVRFIVRTFSFRYEIGRK